MNDEHRVELQTVIPLDTPYLVYLDPSNICNFRCPYCPTGNPKMVEQYRRPTMMEYKLYWKIIHDLCDMPQKIKTLRLYKNGEPLLNPNIIKMINFAKKSGRFEKVDLTTNGSMLSIFMSKMLVQAGLDLAMVSVPTDYTDRYVEGVESLYKIGRGVTQVFCKLIDDGTLTATDRHRFLNTFGDISDRIYIENLSPCWPDYKEGGVHPANVGLFGQPIENIKVCSYLFYSVAINSDGTVSTCCQDWKHELIIGDLKHESFSDVWNGSRLRAIRLAHLRKERFALPGCWDCGQLNYGKPDNIDKYRLELLEKFGVII
jgi:radical SAM protein with 4Fe4S-binding SPASM domain